MKVFSVIDRFMLCISSVMFIISSSENEVNILCMLVWVMVCSIGCNIVCLLKIMVVIMLIVLVVVIQLCLLDVLFVLVVSSGSSVIIGIVVMFWNSRMLKLVVFVGVCIRLCLESVVSVIVVDDSVSFSFVIIVVCYGWFIVMIVSLMVSVYIRICSLL